MRGHNSPQHNPGYFAEQGIGMRRNVAEAMLAGGFKGTFALEYEQGPLNGVEGAKYLYNEVLAALTTPTPVTGD